MPSTKEIQRRIKSVKNIKKITKAMEMVSAVKMRKTIDAVLRTRTYANLSWMTVLNIAGSAGVGRHLHPLLDKREETKREAVVLISSNRGLCGNFNSAVVQKAVKSILKHGTEERRLTERMVKEARKDVDFILLGKKGLAVKSRYNIPVSAEFPKQDVTYEIRDVMPIAKMVIDDYLSGKYDKVMVAYTDFINAAKQVPRVKQLLPIDLSAKDDHLGVVGLDPRVGLDKDFIKGKEEKYLSGQNAPYPYVFTYEPDAEKILTEILPRLIEIQLFQALLESNASEHSARMSAMKKASDAAEDITSELTLYYNKARQASITREISELVAGVNALSN
jgi:F-type H+-transporting ATPase subunit gamma